MSLAPRNGRTRLAFFQASSLRREVIFRRSARNAVASFDHRQPGGDLVEMAHALYPLAANAAGVETRGAAVRERLWRWHKPHQWQDLCMTA